MSSSTPPTFTTENLTINHPAKMTIYDDIVEAALRNQRKSEDKLPLRDVDGDRYKKLINDCKELREYVNRAASAGVYSIAAYKVCDLQGLQFELFQTTRDDSHLVIDASDYMQLHDFAKSFRSSRIWSKGGTCRSHTRALQMFRNADKAIATTRLKDILKTDTSLSANAEVNDDRTKLASGSQKTETLLRCITAMDCDQTVWKTIFRSLMPAIGSGKSEMAWWRPEDDEEDEIASFPHERLARPRAAHLATEKDIDTLRRRC